MLVQVSPEEMRNERFRLLPFSGKNDTMVSSMGTVMKQDKHYRWHQVPQTVSKDGSARVRLYDHASGKMHRYSVARLVAMTFLPVPADPDATPHVGHRDGNPLNNRASNLIWE